MMARIGTKLIAICSAAIGIIYAAGYVVTESTAANTVPNELAIARPAPSNKPSTPPIQTQPADLFKPEITSTPVAIGPAESAQSTETTHATTKPVVATQQPAIAATHKPAIIKPLPTNEANTPALTTTKPQKLELSSTSTPTPTPIQTPIAAQTPTPIAPQTQTPTSIAPQTPTPTPTPTPIPTPSPSLPPLPIVQNKKYHDGTYKGSGTNRFGTVEVEVTIEKAKIAKVDITNITTRYPQFYIDPLPADVIHAQDYQVDTISGATYSSEDFINAVKAALMQAEGIN